MKNRFCKFLVMLLTVIAVGSGATMLNLSMQEKATGEKVSFSPYGMMDQAYLAEEPPAATYRAGDQIEAMEQQDGQAAADEKQSSDGEEPLSDMEKPLSDSETQACNSEKQVYYSRLQDMERAYMARMNAAAKEALAVQQKTAGELLEIWDDELNAIYQKLRRSLSEEDFRSLRDEERAWIRDRDAAANQAAAKENYSNSAQNLAYTCSLLQWTKERVYELAAMYYGE